jgi:hypothetical protein
MRSKFFYSIVLFVQICTATEVWGQDKMFIPMLNNHRFIDNRIVLDPFIKSSFQLNMGLGESSKLNLPVIEIGDTSFVPTAGTLVFANLNAELNVTLNEAVAYYLSISFSARLGAEPSSLYSNGINTISGIHNAWKIRLFQDKKNYLSTIVGISTYDASLLNISKFVHDIINGKPNAAITDDINVLRGFMGLQYAHAFGSLVGMNLMGQFTYGDLFETGKSGGQVTASAALDLNLYPKTRIPIGLSLAYAWAQIPDYTTAQYTSTMLVNAKLAYSGSDSFIISVDASSFESTYVLGRIADGSNIKTRVLNYALNVLIYFN